MLARAVTKAATLIALFVTSIAAIACLLQLIHGAPIEVIKNLQRSRRV